jgi:hypothetical protein
VTKVETMAVMVVKKEVLLTIWSVAPVSIYNPRRILWIMRVVGLYKLKNEKQRILHDE